MKFMKLGSRPDTFYTTEAVRSVSSEVSSDLIVQVKGSRYLLHKFPLLSKCGTLQRLCSEIPESATRVQIVELPDFPGGAESFELCAKFCYGITITLSPYNVVSMCCAAEYLRMSEDVERGNLIRKIEAFFGSCVLRGWRDTIVCLKSTKHFPMWSEDLGITGRCIEAAASKVSARPAKVDMSNGCSRRGRDDIISCNGSESRRRHDKESKGNNWWAEDLAELGIDLYWGTMIAVKSRGTVRPNLIGEALRIYASRWLSNVSRHLNKSDDDGETTSNQRLLLESIVSLLPAEKGSVSCSFLLKLLKASNILRSSPSIKTELARRAGLQLDEAAVSDLLIPSVSSTKNIVYDVDVVMTILDQFFSRGRSPSTSPVRAREDFERRRSRSAENVDLEFLQESRRSSSRSHGSKLKVAKLVDAFLLEVAKDKNMPLSKFVAVAERIPEFARVDHDGLYRAIDAYLKAHPELGKSERKRLCGALDCKKLSMEACLHAAQNEMLPLRVVVKVLFFEQARAATAGGRAAEALPENIRALISSRKNAQSKATADSFSTSTSVIHGDGRSQASNVSTLRMKLAEEDGGSGEDLREEARRRNCTAKSLSIVHSGPKRMFSKLWPISRGASERK